MNYSSLLFITSRAGFGRAIRRIFDADRLPKIADQQFPVGRRLDTRGRSVRLPRPGSDLCAQY